MSTFAKLKDGTLWVVYSDNQTEENMDLIDIKDCDEHGNYDPEFFITKRFSYSDILVTDTNIEVVKQHAILDNAIVLIHDMARLLQKHAPMDATHEGLEVCDILQEANAWLEKIPLTTH
jgi:hypothetical protein